MTKDIWGANMKSYLVSNPVSDFNYLQNELFHVKIISSGQLDAMIYNYQRCSFC